MTNPHPTLSQPEIEGMTRCHPPGGTPARKVAVVDTIDAGALTSSGRLEGD